MMMGAMMVMMRAMMVMMVARGDFQIDDGNH